MRLMCVAIGQMERTADNVAMVTFKDEETLREEERRSRTPNLSPQVTPNLSRQVTPNLSPQVTAKLLSNIIADYLILGNNFLLLRVINV